MSRVLDNIQIPGYNVLPSVDGSPFKVDFANVYVNEEVIVNETTLSFFITMYSQWANAKTVAKITVEEMVLAHIAEYWRLTFDCIQNDCSPSGEFTKDNYATVLNQLIDGTLPECVKTLCHNFKVEKVDKKAIYIFFHFRHPSVRTASFGHESSTFTMYGLWDKDENRYVPVKSAQEKGKVTLILNSQRDSMSEEEFVNRLKGYVEFDNIYGAVAGIKWISSDISYACPLIFRLEWHHKDNMVTKKDFRCNIAFSNIAFDKKRIKIGGNSLYPDYGRASDFTFNGAEFSSDREWKATAKKTVQSEVQREVLVQEFIDFLCEGKYHIIYSNLLRVEKLFDNVYNVFPKKSKSFPYHARNDLQNASLLVQVSNNNKLDIVAQTAIFKDKVQVILNGEIDQSVLSDEVKRHVLAMQLSV